MRAAVGFGALAILSICGWQGDQVPVAHAQLEAPPPIRILFSPEHPCTDAIVEEIAAARQSVNVQAYRLTSAPITQALLAAHQRGVRVVILIDSEGATPGKYSDATPFVNAGVPVLVDGEHTIAHNKVMILDGQTVITGSFNFTKQAPTNAENLLIIRGVPELTAAYLGNFEQHMKHSVAITPAPAGAQQPARPKRRIPVIIRQN